MAMARLAVGRTTALTADEIIDVALRQADDFGLDALTMGNIAGELNVSQMALYRHFASKSDLLQATLDRVWVEALEIGYLPPEPIEVLVTFALSLWRAFARHPQMGALIGATPEPGPSMDNVAVAAETVLQQVGFAPGRLAEAYLPVTTYVIGAIAVLGSRAEARGVMGRADSDALRERFRVSTVSGPGSEVLSAMVPTVAEAEASYERGLRALVAGLLAEQARAVGSVPAEPAFD
jgi:AcrR family transcriptional regulator